MTDDGWRGKVGVMEQDEIARFLEEPAIARLATVDAEGWPYVVPVWQEWSAGKFWVVPREKSAWAKHLAREPRCSIAIDESGSQRKVIAQCVAELIEKPNVGGQWVEVAQRMSLRYLGEHGPDYLAPTLDSPRWLFSLRPIKVWTWQGNDWASRYKT